MPGGNWLSADRSETERLSMAKKDRTGNRKAREQRKQFKVPELGCKTKPSEMWPCTTVHELVWEIEGKVK